MSSLNRNTKDEGHARRVAQVFNGVVDQFQENQDIILPSESEVLRLRYRERDRKLHIWQASKKCIFKGCARQSVRKSHTIQQEGSLRAICEKGHILTPTFDPKKEGLKLSPIGVREASTFPGFCKEHESIFHEFESRHSLSEPRDFQLQIYRTICRELVLKRSLLTYFQNMRDDYLKFRQRRLFEMTEKRLSSTFLKKHKVSLKSFSIDKFDARENMMDNQISTITQDIEAFQEDFYDAVCRDIESGQDEQLFAQGYHIDLQLPVCLAGRGNFFIKEDEASRNIGVILIVLPFADSTHIFAATPQRNRYALEEYFAAFTKHALVVLTMVESWMLHGSDHWFLRPSTWNQIRPDTQRMILDSIASTENNIGYPSEHSIFNELRAEFLSTVPLSKRGQLHASFRDFLRDEDIKLEKSIAANAS
jgi:hypothetical protein